MRKFKGADTAQYAAGNPRMKLITMFIGVLALMGAWIYSQVRVQQYQAEEVQDVPAIVAEIAVPTAPVGTFDEVADATPEERVVLERSQLEVVKAVTRQLTPGHFEQLDVPRLDAATWSDLQQHAAERRGSLLTARGQIEMLRPREDAPGRIGDWFGLLRTQDGTPAWFVGLRFAGRELAVGDWVRIDGMFFKRFSEELLTSGEWIEGPLIVAPRMLPSYEDFGPVETFELDLVRTLTDDTLEDHFTMPELVKWRVLAAMRDMPEDAIDWANAPTLDGPTNAQIVADGKRFRGQPFLLPTSRMQGMKVVRTGENPAGFEYVTEAWIANGTWTKHEPLLHVLAPGSRPDMEISSLLQGRIVFLRNMAYTTARNTLRVVPVFAAYELTPFSPPSDHAYHFLVAGFLAVAVGLTILIVVLLRRDKRRSRALEDKLLQRRRKRREQQPAGV